MDTTSIIAALVAFIAWREWSTNRQRLKLDLFDRRYEIYLEIAETISAICIEGKVRPGKEFEFLRKTNKAYFLFSCASWVKYLISDIYKKMNQLHALDAELESLTGDARKPLVEERRQIKNWFETTLHELEGRFECFLKLSH